MNKIQTTKANTTLRRFFNRVGGGGVKALTTKSNEYTVNKGGDDSGGESSSTVTFPITPTKIVGYIDNTNQDAYQIDYDTWTAELNKDIIAPEDLMEYCKNSNNGEYAQYFFDTIIEYDPNIDRSRRYEDDYHTSPYIDGGICNILISYDLNGDKEYNVGRADFYCHFVKTTINGKDYLLVIPAGD